MTSEGGSRHGMSKERAAAGKTDQPNAGPTIAHVVVIRTFDFLVAVRWPAALAFSVWKAMPYLAGRTTEAIFLILFRRVGAFDATPWTLMSGVIVWALLERYLRRRKTIRLAGRVRALELLIDPDRSSSGLADTEDSRR